MVAEWQHIVYKEYLPTILGDRGVAMLGQYRGYDPTVNPSIANVFATAAFRFGHSQILPVLQRLDPDYRSIPAGPLRLQDAFFAPFRLLEEGSLDSLLRGLVATPIKQRSSSSGLNSNLTEALFIQVCMPNYMSMDLCRKMGAIHVGIVGAGITRALKHLPHAPVDLRLMYVYLDELVINSSMDKPL